MGKKSSVGFVFTTLTQDASGWTNPAIAWGLGLLTVTYPLTGFQGCQAQILIPGPGYRES